MKTILLCKPELTSATKTSVFIQKTKNIVLKRMLRYVQKTPPLKI